jgi:predicted RND superfamily exporter protein
MNILENIISVTTGYIILHAKVILATIVIVIMSAIWPATKLTIDASTDSLLLDNDPELNFYRNIHDKYGTDEYILVVLEFNKEILEKTTLDLIEEIRQKFESLSTISAVTSITNIPLVYQRILENGQWSFPTLLSRNVDFNKAKNELSTNPLYAENIIDSTLAKIAFKVDLHISPLYKTLYKKRFELTEKGLSGYISSNEKNELVFIEKNIDALNIKSSKDYKTALTNIRNLIKTDKNIKRFYISGTPMIISDIRDYVTQDIKIFGLAVLIFMVTILFVIFKDYKWVIITLGCACMNVVIVTEIIYLFNFNLTIVSSNYIAILIIFSLAIGIHVVIRYQEELAHLHGSFDDRLIIALKHISTPCMYMVITSMVAFISLIISNIKPIMVFGYIMAIGLCIAYIISFTALPLAIKILHPSAKHQDYPVCTRILNSVLSFSINNKFSILIFLSILFGISLYGINHLTVENRFIDYFKKSTEIHQGLLIIDQHFGGTVPIEIILDKNKIDTIDEEIVEDSEFDDYLSTLEEADGGYTSQSYWYNHRGIAKINQIHSYLEGLPQIGKILSLSSSQYIFKQALDIDVMDDFQLATIYAKSPPDINNLLIRPYLSEDGMQARIVARIKDSDRDLVRNDLLLEINNHISNIYPKSDNITVNITGIGVLYNNVLQSLYRSQILTIGFVFTAIFIMLSILFKSIKYAFIAILPNIFTAFFILGLMGLLSIPLNIMTITIAAIVIGIGVDDSIHYIHRFKKELAASNNIKSALKISQMTVGKALWFTSFTIGAGFILLIFSNFIPSVHFGLFTSVAMIGSIIATFTIVPITLSTLISNEP